MSTDQLHGLKALINNFAADRAACYALLLSISTALAMTVAKQQEAYLASLSLTTPGRHRWVAVPRRPFTLVVGEHLCR